MVVTGEGTGGSCEVCGRLVLCAVTHDYAGSNCQGMGKSWRGQEHIPHTVMPKQPLWLDITQVGFMDSRAKFRSWPSAAEFEIHQTIIRWCFSNHLSRFGESAPTVALHSCAWLTGMKPNGFFCLFFFAFADHLLQGLTSAAFEKAQIPQNDKKKSRISL